MMGITIPTLYYTLNEDFTKDDAYKTLKNCYIFDTSFCSDAIYTRKYKTAIEWLSQITSALLDKDEDDLFVVCNSMLSFAKDITEKEICGRIVDAGQKGAQILLGNICTARDLYKISNCLYWTDVFYNASFIVVYKSAFRQIANLVNQGSIQELCLEQALAIVLDYIYFSYPFLTSNTNHQLSLDTSQTWHNGVTSHFCEGLDNQIKIFNEKSEQFPYNRL